MSRAGSGQRRCAFCGRSGSLTREHVLPDWLAGIGLEVGPGQFRAGWLNRLPRTLGNGQPFTQKVRDVCEDCNHGWMSDLEAAASHVLRPLILGEPTVINEADAGVVAAWTHKTALVAMLVSSVEDREAGYGVPESEFRALYDARETMRPLDASQFWIGRWSGAGAAYEQVTPLVVRADELGEQKFPHAYLMTVIVGQLVVQGVRFTTSAVEIMLATRRDLARLWPATGSTDWPSGKPLDEADVIAFCGGRELIVEDLPLKIEPRRPATDLEESRLVGATVELDAPCGQHVVYYPAVLAGLGMRGVFHAFVTACECGIAYLVETRSDGAHFTADTATSGDEAVKARYEALYGVEIEIHDSGGVFLAKRLEAPVDHADDASSR